MDQLGAIVTAAEVLKAAISSDVDSFRAEILKMEHPRVILQKIRTTLGHFLSLNNKYGKDLVEYLKRIGIDLEGEKTNEESPILFAARYGDRFMCKWLVGLNAFNVQAVNDQKQSALHMAVLNEKHAEEVVNYFLSLEVEVDVNGRDKVGKSVLYYALEAGKEEIAKILVANKENKADLNMRIGFNNLLHSFVWANNLKSAKLVFKMKPDLLHGCSIAEETALHIAVRIGDRKMIKWLVDQGIDVHKKSTFGLTALEVIPLKATSLIKFCRALFEKH